MSEYANVEKPFLDKLLSKRKRRLFVVYPHTKNVGINLIVPSANYGGVLLC